MEASVLPSLGLSSNSLSEAQNPTSSHRKSNGALESHIVVVGNPGVGKSALVVRLLTGRFIWEYDPTLEITLRHCTTVDDEPAVMNILDTAQEVVGFSIPLTETHVRWGEGFVIVFSVTDRKSFSAVPLIHTGIATLKRTYHFPCALVGNKTDLGHLREVKVEEAEGMAAQLGVSLFFTSASEGGPNIPQPFAEIHRDVIRHRSLRRRRSSAKAVLEGFYKMFSR